MNYYSSSVIDQVIEKYGSLIDQMIEKYEYEAKILREDTMVPMSEGLAKLRIAEKIDEIIKDLYKIKSDLNLI